MKLCFPCAGLLVGNPVQCFPPGLKFFSAMGKKRKKLRGTVSKVIKPALAGESEKAEIALHGGDDLYREIRIENILTDEHGNSATLKVGDSVDVIVEMDSDTTKEEAKG